MNSQSLESGFPGRTLPLTGRVDLGLPLRVSFSKQALLHLPYVTCDNSGRWVGVRHSEKLRRSRGKVLFPFATTSSDGYPSPLL